MDWELTKENCVPIRQGRSKAALQELADPATDALEAKRRELWAEVSGYKGDDPLEAWQRYIKWMQEYGVGGGKADLMKVLEACTKDLQKYPRYTSDIRFLRIWIQYADCLPDPGDVFLFLKEKGIGRAFTLYYEAYATYFELKGNFPDADAVYQDGVQRGAKPLERLKQKHMAFQQRMAHRLQRKIQDEQVMGPPPSEPVRSSLTTLGGRSGSRPHGGAAQQQQSTLGGIFGAAAPPPQHASLLGPRPGQQAQPQQRGLRPAVGLLEDEEFAGVENPFPCLPGYSSMPQVNNLRELKPYGVIRKENLDRPSTWSQTALLPGAPPAAAGAPSGGASGLAIFTDEEFQDGGDPESAGIAAGGAGPLNPGFGREAAGPGLSTSHPLLQLAGVGMPGVDALMSSLAPPPALLRDLLPAAAQSTMGSMAQTALAAPAVPGGPSHTPLSGAPLPAAAAAPESWQRPTEAGSSSSHHTRLGSVPTAEAAAGTSEVPAVRPQVQGGNAAGESVGTGKSDGGVEEMSFEELRAEAWYRRNHNAQLAPALHTAGDRAALSAPSRSGACKDSRADACESGGAQVSACRGVSTKPTVGSGDGARSHCGGSTVGGGGDLSCPPAHMEAHCSAAGPKGVAGGRNPFGQVAPSVPAGAGQQTGSTALENLPKGGSASANENDTAAVGVNAKRRALADAAPVPRATLAPRPEPSGAKGPVPKLPAAPTAEATDVSAAVRGRVHTSDDTQATVTISTRGAFDLLNSLFSEDLPHQHLGKPGHRSSSEPAVAAPQPQPQPPRRETEPPWRPAPQQPAGPAPPSVHAPAAEPTVTLHTRLAFDALNDMFSDTLPHEEARKLGRRTAVDNGATASMKPISNSDVRRLANAGRSFGGPVLNASGRGPPCSGAGGVFGTMASSSAATTAAATAPALAVHEDTFFLGPVAAAAAATAATLSHGSSGGGGTRALPIVNQSHGQLQGSEVSAIYEDTEFIPRGPARGGAAGNASNNAVLPGGAFILEDTEFLTRPHAPQLAAAASTSNAVGRAIKANGESFLAAAAPSSLAAQNRTQRPGLPSSGVSPRMGGPREAATVHGARVFPVQSTVGAGQQHRNLGGSLQIYEDTQYVRDSED